MAAPFLVWVRETSRPKEMAHNRAARRTTARAPLSASQVRRIHRAATPMIDTPTASKYTGMYALPHAISCCHRTVCATTEAGTTHRVRPAPRRYATTRGATRGSEAKAKANARPPRTATNQAGAEV